MTRFYANADQLSMPGLILENNRCCKMEPVWQDVRYALCGFRWRPVFELTAVLTLRGMRET
jgi:hypothetical protein